MRNLQCDVAFQIGLSATKKNPVQLQNVLRAQLVRFDILLKLQSLVSKDYRRGGDAMSFERTYGKRRVHNSTLLTL